MRLEMEEIFVESKFFEFAFEIAKSMCFFNPITTFESVDETLTDGVVKETRAKNTSSDIGRRIGDEDVVDEEMTGEDEFSHKFGIALNGERANFASTPFGVEGVSERGLIIGLKREEMITEVAEMGEDERESVNFRMPIGFFDFTITLIKTGESDFIFVEIDFPAVVSISDTGSIFLLSIRRFKSDPMLMNIVSDESFTNILIDERGVEDGDGVEVVEREIRRERRDFFHINETS